MAARDLHLHRVKFIPVHNGDLIEQPTVKRYGYGSSVEYNDAGHSHLVGFKPGRAGRAEGHLVYLVHEGVSSSLIVHKARPAK